MQTDKTNKRSQRILPPRTPPEKITRMLEEHFPEHDVDEPIVDVGRRVVPPATATTGSCVRGPRGENKTSIRALAEEHRLGRMDHHDSSARKRAVKLWKHKDPVEPVETAQNDAQGQWDSAGRGNTSHTVKPVFRWVRGELIGQGTRSRVYLALNATNGEMIAAKQVEISRTAGGPQHTSAMEALMRESKTLKDLDHSNIVQYIGFEVAPLFMSIFLEYIPGGSLAECLKLHGKIGDEEVIKSFTGHILDGIEYLHSRKIVHGNLQPKIVLIDMRGVCKISSFGRSRNIGDAHAAAVDIPPRVSWAAPELIDSNRTIYGPKADVWSLGCIVFEMWTGRCPWDGNDAAAILLQGRLISQATPYTLYSSADSSSQVYRTQQGPPLPSDIALSHLAEDFRQKCFKINSAERPTAADIRQHAYLVPLPGWSFTGFT